MKKVVVRLRNTKRFPCPQFIPLYRSSEKLWNELKGKTVIAEKSRKKYSCGEKKYVLADERVAERRAKLAGRYKEPVYAQYTFCGHIVLREEKSTK
jgi:hypothetical protein